MRKSDDSASSDLPALAVSVGHAHLQHGRTVLELLRSGGVIIRNVEDTDERRFETSLPSDKLTSLLQMAAQLAHRRSARPGIPDEARYRFEVQGHLGETIVAELWESELEQDRALRDLLHELRSIVTRGSGGEVLL